VGDEVLIKVSEILQKEMRKYDTCIRYAGDEFVAFLYNAEREIAERIVTRIRKAVTALVLKVRSGKEVRLGISVGMSMYPDDGVELTQLFTVADSQMYNDKFESKAELARLAEASLQEAVELEEEIEFQRAQYKARRAKVEVRNHACASRVFTFVVRTAALELLASYFTFAFGHFFPIPSAA
jgi:GGDEF domain-containing protein